MNDTPAVSVFWPADNPAAMLHITILQQIITRLANNSASCKTWCLTLVAALLSLAAATRTPQMVTAALVPVAIFGFLDIMYLATEIAYRDLYGRVIGRMQSGIYQRSEVFEAKARPDGGCFALAMVSWSVMPYYALVAFYAIATAAGGTALLAAAPK